MNRSEPGSASNPIVKSSLGQSGRKSEPRMPTVAITPIHISTVAHQGRSNPNDTNSLTEVPPLQAGRRSAPTAGDGRSRKLGIHDHSGLRPIGEPEPQRWHRGGFARADNPIPTEAMRDTCDARWGGRSAHRR